MAPCSLRSGTAPPHRSTRDADLRGFGPDDERNLITTFRDIAAIDLGDTAVRLDDLLWPTTLDAATGIQATTTWRPETLLWDLADLHSL